MSKKSIAILVILFHVFSLSAQQIEGHYVLNWQEMKTEQISTDLQQTYLYFDNAKVDYFPPALMPLFYLRTPIASLQQAYTITISNTQWRTLSQAEVSSLNMNKIADSLTLSYNLEETAKQFYFNLSFLPFKTNGKQLEQLLSFDLQAIPMASSSYKIRKSNTYTAHSILKSGNFYKMGISKTGIYKITPEDFKQLGINSSVSISQIAIFGNGGEQLPESTSAFVFDDLQEVAIYIDDNNNNGIFDNNDYILFSLMCLLCNYTFYSLVLHL